MQGLTFGAGQNCKIVDGVGLWSSTQTIYIAYRMNNYAAKRQGAAGNNINALISADTPNQILYQSQRIPACSTHTREPTGPFL